MHDAKKHFMKNCLNKFTQRPETSQVKELRSNHLLFHCFLMFAALFVSRNAIQKHPGCKKGEAKSEAPVNVKITSESTGD